MKSKILNSSYAILFVIAGMLPVMAQTKGKVKDVDGNTYNTLIIDGKEWMIDNLNVGRYRNGDQIDNIVGDKRWAENQKGAWAYYDNNLENGKTFGRIYNDKAVEDTRGICPEGWHIPTEQEWKYLFEIAGGFDEGGDDLKAANALWQDGYPGNNKTGFSALPGGYRSGGGGFEKIGYEVNFWSVDGRITKILRNWINFSNSGGDASYCRCVKD